MRLPQQAKGGDQAGTLTDEAKPRRPRQGIGRRRRQRTEAERREGLENVPAAGLQRESPKDADQEEYFDGPYDQAQNGGFLMPLGSVVTWPSQAGPRGKPQHPLARNGGPSP